MEASNASNVVQALSISSLLASSPPQFQSGERVDCESLLLLFDQIWMKLIELAKKLCDIMRAYNEVRQRLAWELQNSALDTQMHSIGKKFEASIFNAGGSILSGILTMGFGIVGGESSIMLGHGVGNILSGSFSLGGGVMQCQSDQNSAIADLQQKGAQFYNKTLMDTMEKALEIMQQIIRMGASLVEVLAQMLRSLMR